MSCPKEEYYVVLVILYPTKNVSEGKQTYRITAPII